MDSRFALCYLRRVSSPTNQNEGCAQGWSGSCEVFEGGASQTGQHAEKGEEPDGHTQQSEKVEWKIIHHAVAIKWGIRRSDAGVWALRVSEGIEDENKKHSRCSLSCMRLYSLIMAPISEGIQCGQRSVASIAFPWIRELTWRTLQSLISILICQISNVLSTLLSLSFLFPLIHRWRILMIIFNPVAYWWLTIACFIWLISIRQLQLLFFFFCNSLQLIK